ncbi:MAG: uracil-DNA glycosylase [Candidatus Caenarcaniphilales bacterium]|nr:uracil-DNA glycosylase [Candidatus Caenarcaniphilales bacterium]
MSASQPSLFDLFAKPSGEQINLADSPSRQGLISKNHDDLVAMAKACTKCPLCKTRTEVVVFDGNSQAKLMLIGEGPGEQEDLSGLPFVGKAGQMLDKILDAVKIDRKNDTYICNIVKCRPPANRVPTPQEMEACIPYIEDQIRLVGPKIILLLGATAVTGILKLKSPRITALHGKWIEGSGDLLRERKIMPFYHPSYLLRNQSREEGSPKWQAWQAAKEVKAYLDSLA